jgi:taurine---2-oxoglutarate transaminase
VISSPIVETFSERVYPGGLTYSGHPLACAAAVATITTMADEGIVGHAKHIGDDILRPGLNELADRHPVIGEVRGTGVFFALDLVKDRATKEELAPYGGTSEAMGALGAAMKAEGLFPFMNYHRLHVVPPCTISDDEAREALDRLDRALKAIDSYYEG